MFVCLCVYLSYVFSYLYPFCVYVHLFICPSKRLSIYISECLYVNLFVFPSVCVYIYLSVHLSACSFVRLSICSFVHLFVCPSVRLSVYLSVFPFLWLSFNLFAQSGAHEWCFTQVGSGLTHKHYTRLEKLARDKHSSLLWKSINYSCKRITVQARGERKWRNSCL